ncbi:transposon ty3-I gag-pol polyprotein [Tanacetum coccineum]
MSSDPNYQWHVRETITITSTQNTDGIVQIEETSVSIRPDPVQVEEKPVRIIPGPAGIVQLAKIRKQSDIHEGGDDSVLSTQKYTKQVVKDVGEDEDFNSGPWVGATEYVKANGGIFSGCIGDIKTFLKNGKLEQVVAIIKSCSPNALGDLKVTVKDLSGTLPGLIHYKVINEGGYGKEITVGSAIILANVSWCRWEWNVDGRRRNSEIGGRRRNDLELHVCGNVIDQEDLNKFDEEALDLVLEEETMESRAHEEWLEKYRPQEEEDAEHERQLLGFHGTI